MADIDQIIAGGAKTNADFNFNKINQAYWEGKDQAAKNDLREAFKSGLPMKGDQVDWPAVTQKFFQVGAIDQGIAAAGQGLAQQNLERSQSISDVVNGGQPYPPSASRPSGTPDPAYRRDASTDQPKTPLPPDQQQDPNSDIYRMPSAQAVQDWRNSVPVSQLPGQSQQPVAQAPQAQPAQVAQAPQAQPAPNFDQRFSAARPGQGPDPTLGGLIPAGRDAATQIRLLSKAIDSGVLRPEVAKAYQARIDAITKAIEPTNAMKEAAAQNLTLQQSKEREGEQASKQAGDTERAKADVAEQNEYIKGGKVASDRLSTLNTISNIISSDKMGLGFGADTQLKVQMALKRFGVDVGDLSGPQAIQKLNAVLASESAKGVGARPTQFEFKTFLANNPGLSMDKAGNERVIGIYSQLAKREVDLGRLARSNQDNWSNWDNVVEKYDKTHPIKDPTSGKVITTDSIVAPGPKQDAKPAAPASFANQKFANPDAARAAGAKKGDIVTDADGKQWRLK